MILALRSALGDAPAQPDPTNLWKGPQQVDDFLAANPELQPIADQPQAKWINTLADAQNIPNLVSGAVAAGNKTLLLCIYAIPGRDSGNYSAGGFPDRASYLSFLQTVKTNVGNHPTIISYEPDALGLTPGMTATNRAERIETLRQGVGILSTIPNAETYIDASQWIAVVDQASMLQSVDIHLIRGITINTSGYEAQANCYSYANAVLAELVARGISGKKFVVDSSRNGVGPLTEADRPLASPWLDTQQAWCNPPNRRLGPTPGLVSGQANCRATLWIKQPGESDGTFPTTAQSSYYGENAPNAGTFWLANARSLLGLSPQKNTTPNLSNIVASFDSDYGPFTPQGGGVSLVGGRLRLPCGVNTYENAITANTYSPLGKISARVYPASAGGATTANMVTTDLLVLSTVGDTRLVARVDTAKNVTYLGAETGYYDPAGVNLTYDPIAHAWLQIRSESGTTYWETSPDGIVWTQRKSAATPSWLGTAGTSAVQLITNRDTGTPNFAEFDNVNISPILNASASAGLSGSGQLTATVIARPTTTAALSGSGSLSTTQSPSVSRAAGLSGSGTLDAWTIQLPGAKAADLTGSGTLTASASATSSAQASVSGSGTLGASPSPRHLVSASLNGSGSLTASTVPLVVTSAALSGSGNLAVATASSVALTAALSSVGSLSGIAIPSVAALAALSGSGSLSSAEITRLTGSAALTGSGALTAGVVAALLRDAQLTSSGTLSTSSSVQVSRSADLASVGSLSAAVQPIRMATAALAGSGTLSSMQLIRSIANAALSGSGQLSTNSIIARSADANLSGSGQLSASVAAVRATMTAVLSGSGSLVAQTALQGEILASMSGVGTLSALITPTHAIATSVSGQGTLTSDVRVIASRGAALSSTGQLTASSIALMSRMANLSGAGQLAASVVALRVATADLGSSGTLTTTTVVLRVAAADLIGVGELDAQSTAVNLLAVAALSGEGILTVTTQGLGVYRDITVTWGQLRVGSVKLDNLRMGSFSPSKLRVGSVTMKLRS